MNIELTVEALNNTNSGISIGDLKLSCLLYTDDFFFLGNPEAELQHFLDTFHKWCRQWRIKMNTSKSIHSFTIDHDPKLEHWLISSVMEVIFLLLSIIDI